MFLLVKRRYNSFLEVCEILSVYISKPGEGDLALVPHSSRDLLGQGTEIFTSIFHFCKIRAIIFAAATDEMISLKWKAWSKIVIPGLLAEV